MKRQYCFNKNKFLKLELKQQHKKCAEFLQHILAHSLDLSHYNELCSWLEIVPVANDQKAIQDRYHWHIAKSSTQISENRFFISTEDKETGQAFLPITIYLDHLRAAQNVGSILRTIEAFRLGKVAFSENMCRMDHPQVVKCSMGTSNWLEYVETPLKDLPRPIIGVETVATAPHYFDFAFPDSFTLAVGNEEYGLSDEVIQLADQVVQIPLYGRKNSINVACAFAIIAAEISRQKRILPKVT